MTGELPYRLVADVPPAEAGLDREAAEPRDPAPRVGLLEADRARRRPVHLDHEAAERRGLGVGALELREQHVAIGGAHRREERRDLVVRHERDEEVQISRNGSPEAHLGHCSFNLPEPIATPARISTSPASVATVIGSSSSTAP